MAETAAVRRLSALSAVSAQSADRKRERTFLNGRRVSEPQLLTHDDAIGLGLAVPLLRFVDPDPTLVVAGRLRYEERTMLFSLGSQPVPLTPTQFRLLLHLYRHAGDVCSRES